MLSACGPGGGGAVGLWPGGGCCRLLARGGGGGGAVDFWPGGVYLAEKREGEEPYII